MLEPPSTRETVSQNAFGLVRSRAERTTMQLWNTKVLVNEVQVKGEPIWSWKARMTLRHSPHFLHHLIYLQRSTRNKRLYRAASDTGRQLSQCEHKTIQITNQPPGSPAGANPNTSCCMEEPELLSGPQRAEQTGCPISVYRDLLGWGSSSFSHSANTTLSRP